MRGWSPEEDEMLLQLIEVRFHHRLTLLSHVFARKLLLSASGP